MKFLVKLNHLIMSLSFIITGCLLVPQTSQAASTFCTSDGCRICIAQNNCKRIQNTTTIVTEQGGITHVNGVPWSEITDGQMIESRNGGGVVFGDGNSVVVVGGAQVSNKGSTVNTRPQQVLTSNPRFCDGAQGYYSENGGGFIAASATVAPNVHVDEMSSICGNATVNGNARIINSTVMGNTVLNGNSNIIDSFVEGNPVFNGVTNLYGVWITDGVYSGITNLSQANGQRGKYERLRQ